MSADSSVDVEELTTEEETAEVTAEASADGEAEAAETEAQETAAPETTEAAIDAIRGAMQSGKAVTGTVVAAGEEALEVEVDGVTCSCELSQMELGDPRPGESYVGQEFEFFVLTIEGDDQVVLSRVSHLRQQAVPQGPPKPQKIETGAVLQGKVVTVKDFGAFVDLGGTQGLVHISELARRRVEKTEDVVQPGDDVTVKVLKIDKGGRRISLSMKALEPDPWRDAAEKYSTGMTIEGIVEKVERFGAFIQLEPGLSGLLPSSKMMIPRDSSAARVFPPGKRLNVKVLSIEPRRQRISLGLEGDASEGSREDYEAFKKSQTESDGGFNALAAALSKIQQ